jgi:predicted murein hydrolase (TIGR00659 family)
MKDNELFQIWVYLSASPLLGLTMTLVAYHLAYRLYQAANSNPLANPVALSIALLIGLLMGTGTPYVTYFDGAQFVHFLLGPATVALAVPLYQQLPKLRAIWLSVVVALVTGVTVAALSAVGIAAVLGGSRETLLSMAPKSVTAPVAMGIAEKIGGLPSLTAVMVVATGILGAVFGTKVFDGLRVKDDSIKGFALGLTSHGIGTARAFQISPEMGAFSGLAMALSAFTTAAMLPWLLGVVGLG